MGVKPLYYSFYNETFYFASEQKHYLLRSPLKIAQDGIEEYNRFVAGENTLFQNVNKVLPGHSMTIHEGGKSLLWDLKGNSKPTKN
jgi:asparagine synthase (glutamine-hydrolysing)